MRDPVPDIREIIIDRKEDGGLPSSTFLNLAPEKQEKLLSAAVREFTERPYNEASINRIVREAGIPRGSFYMYFRDKEDLFHYLMEESINEMLMVFEEVLHSQGGDIFAALPAMYDHLRSRRSADRSLGMLRRDNADEEPLEDGVDCEDNEGGELQCARQVDARVLDLFT